MPPLPLFDNIEHIDQCDEYAKIPDDAHIIDYKVAQAFLRCYTGSLGTFNSYRREIERFLHWCWLIAKKSIKKVRHDDIEAFIKFCLKPPKTWIGTKKEPRFIELKGARAQNRRWRPFLVTISKSARLRGDELDIANFALSQNAVKEIFAILSTFYNYLLIEEYALMNPVALVRQKSKFIRKRQGKPKIRRLSKIQWEYTLRAAQSMAEKNPNKHERTLFILSALYSMYLRISELTADSRWSPSMNDFFKDGEDNWWFTTVGKGNKERQIAVSDTMLMALKRWRKHLGLSPLPTPADSSPLIPKLSGRGAVSDQTILRTLIQECFNSASHLLQAEGHELEAEAIKEATVHWLRHTGISDDVKIRPREHVRDDAGHSSSGITDKYIDVELGERHASAKNKKINKDDRK